MHFSIRFQKPLIIALGLLTALMSMSASHAIIDRLAPLTADPPLSLDLSGSWEVCVSNNEAEPIPSLCDWRVMDVPGIFPSAQPSGSRFLMRKRFVTPTACLAGNCSFIFGSLADAGTISLNGATVGEGGLFPTARAKARLYPVAARIPAEALHQERDNTVTLSVFARNPKYVGPYALPVGITETRTAQAYVRSHLTGTVFMPLATVLGLLLVAALVCMFSFKNLENPGLVVALCSYCLVNAWFWASFSDVSYEALSMRYAVPMRYILRRINDASLMAMIGCSITYVGWPRRIWILGAWMTGVVCILGSLWVLVRGCDPSLSPVDIVAMAQNTIAMTWRVKFFAPLAAFAASLFSLKSREMRFGAVCLGGLLAVLVYDSAVFWYLPYTDWATRFHSLVVSGFVAGLIVQRCTRNTMAELSRVEREAALGRTARQVAHDIRSPLAALTMIARHSDGLPEEQRVMVRGAVNRINDISNTLIARNEPARSGSATQTTCVLPMLEMMVTEARVARHNQMAVDITMESCSETFGLFTKVHAPELKRALSNILNNAIESVQGSGRVIVRARGTGANVVVQISDSGMGISPERLAQLGNMGATFGKANGSGLGLYHAKQFLSQCGGSLKIESEVGVGTTVSVCFPSAPAPSWFADALLLQSNHTMVIFDDDESIHRIWDQRFTSLAQKISVEHVFTREEFAQAVATKRRGAVTYLVDYEIRGGTNTGLDCVRALGVNGDSVLVTSRAEEEELQQACLAQRIKLLPKSMAVSVPINLNACEGTADAVLIDDDVLIHAAWRLAATEYGKKISTFKSFDAFILRAQSFHKSIPVYVDFNLDGGLLGSGVTKRLTEMGFSNVHLVTGERSTDLPDMPWVATVAGKDFPQQLCA